ncbi:MAG: GTP-binding protein [Planctomycetes bacterium]|nr:GTP-binding protein [Planctomycetota bacterium]MBI3833592.1 GTP-binding protein [Planctomycetota bacterium]
MPQTTVSILTPPGAGAIGVIRLQGVDAVRVAARVFLPKTGSLSAVNEDGRLRFGRVVDGEEILDEGIGCVSSSGGTPIVDLCVHGGTRVIERVLSTAEKHGATPCSLCAVEVWGASSLIEQEALDDLVAAKTSRTARFLIRQRVLLPRTLRALATPDAPMDLVRNELNRMLAGYSAARRMIDGVTIVIVGPTNSGKSTLFNRLVGRPAAIVSDIEGTTRDWVTENAEIDGVPVTLIDTAGQRATDDLLEELAIAGGADIARRADVIISMLDCSQSTPESIFPGDAHLDVTRILFVASKSDLAPAWDIEELVKHHPAVKRQFLRISAATGDGMDELTARLVHEIDCNSDLDHLPVFFTDRQAIGVEKILNAVGNIENRLVQGLVAELLGV